MSNVFIIVGPSGVGKTTILNRLLHRYGDRLFHPLTYTTRKKRPGESHGVDMYFITETEWHSGHSQYCATGRINGAMYATKSSDVRDALAQGKRVIILLDANGTEEFLTHFPGSIVVALLPEKRGSLDKHLLKRWPEKGPLFDERVKGINREIIEISRLPIDYTIASDSLDDIDRTLEALVFPELRTQAA